MTELYVSDNKIPSLEPLRQNAKLEILDFQTNPISSLAGIEELQELEDVWASNCNISDFREIERALSDKKKLAVVYFEGNPVQKQGPVLYRNKVRLALPQVQKIDAGKCFAPDVMGFGCYTDVLPSVCESGVDRSRVYPLASVGFV